ncbi:MAG: hypothetical protein ACP5N1_00485 [Candidatus Woesearchaeota archaeon]
MNKKGSMELSVNSIVILVIAIVMLGLILGFVRSKFSEVDKGLILAEPEAPTATPSDLLTISRDPISASAGEKLALKVQVYNVNVDEVTPIFTINCDGGLSTASSQFQISSSSISTPGQSNQKYNLIARVPSISKDIYLCTFTATLIGASNADVSKEIVLKIV